VVETVRDTVAETVRNTVVDTVGETVTHTTFHGAPSENRFQLMTTHLVVRFQGTERSDSYESIAELMYSLH